MIWNRFMMLRLVLIGLLLDYLPGGTLPNIRFSSNAFWVIGSVPSDFGIELALVNTKKRYSKKECLVVSHPVGNANDGVNSVVFVAHRVIYSVSL